MDHNSHFLIVGLGILGGSYAQSLSHKGYDVIGIDTNKDNIDYALSHNWIKQGYLQVSKEIFKDINRIIICIYPNDIVNWIKQYQQYFNDGTIISDVCGIKSSIVLPVQQILKPTCEFISAHPMAGKETSGCQYSDDAIFKNANFIIVPTDKNTKAGIEYAYQLASTLGFERISELDCHTHDQMIAFLSQLTHVIAVCLMTSNINDDLVKYTGDSFRDLTRIAKINGPLWTQLMCGNKELLLESIDSFTDQLNKFKKALAENDTQTMADMFALSTSQRKKFDK